MRANYKIQTLDIAKERLGLMKKSFVFHRAIILKTFLGQIALHSKANLSLTVANCTNKCQTLQGHNIPVMDHKRYSKAAFSGMQAHI